VALGVVTRAHGIRGELRVHLYNPESRALFEVDEISLTHPERVLSMSAARVEGVRPGPKGTLLLRLEGVVDRSLAEAMQGAEICVPRSLLPPPDEGEYYLRDLVGLTVTTAEGTSVGEVIEVCSYPTIDCLAVASEDGVREVPMMEPWLVDIDLEAGRAVVGPLDDLPVRPR
jgi:16S rRNA processing protein RimM